MMTGICWITDTPSRLGIMGRLRGDDWLRDEIASLRAQGVDTLVSLLTPDEVGELGLEAESRLCREAGITFTSFPIEDRSVPANRSAFLALVHDLVSDLQAGRGVVIHCRAGIGRSAMLAGAVLARLGIPLPDAIQQIAAARGCPVPDTDEQRRWLDDLMVP